MACSPCSLGSLDGLEGKTALWWLSFEDNLVATLGALGDCSGILWLDVSGNFVSDIGVLTPYGVLSFGGRLDVRGNCLDTSPGSNDLFDIYWLMNNSGTDVLYSDQTGNCGGGQTTQPPYAEE